MSGWIPSGETAERAKTGGSTQTPAEKPLTIKEISFNIEEAKEDLLLTMNRFYIPEISRIEGDNPRVVLDLHPVVLFLQKDYSKIAVNGQYIKQMRSYHDRKAKKLRIVLDMNGSLNYFAQPSFIKSKNLFLLEITEAASKK
ncbi:MAG: AMIN domain-containing protein [Deltaproteobacteria bacterium]|nr:AMIN domain-containing protein [Deltaproteobacteria bacterium]